MLQALAIYACMSLPSVTICFLGVIALKCGFDRLEVAFKLPLWIIFLALWFLVSLSCVLFGIKISEKFAYFALGTFTIGTVFWILSLFFGSRKK
jgi:hypothetical protein